MMLLVSVVSVFLIQAQQNLPAHEQAKSANTAQNSKNVTDHPQIPAPPPETNGNAKQATDDPNKNQRDSHGSSQRNKVDVLNAGSTLVIALFTAFTFCVFLYQIKVTHDAERAWILIDELHKPEHFDWIDVRPDIYPTSDFNWTVKNTGRTPARVLKVQLRYRFIDKLNNLAARPNYGDAKCMRIAEIPTDGTFVAPGETSTIGTFFEGPDGEPSTPTQEQMDAVRTNKAFLVAYGSVLYKDAFKRKHETRFCQVCHVRMPPGKRIPIESWFSAGGPEKYNITT
jgi:hypothetical protein